jgi:UDP-N-acetylglucosamine 1-carboxyvinyltransferase
MDSIIIKGGKALAGEIKISGAKNATLPIMASALLSDKPMFLSNVPKLTDIYTMKQLLVNHGAIIDVKEDNGSLTLSIDCSLVNHFTAPYEIVRKMRASIWVLGPLLARFGQAQVSIPGGCAIGARQVDLHVSVLEAMGANIKIEHGYINATTNRKLRGTHFIFNKISVGATINAIMAATVAEGETVLFNCAREPEVVDLCNCLKSMGAEIEGIGADEVKIIGKPYLGGVSYKIISDRIEAGTYMIGAAITKGEINIIGIDYHMIENIGLKLMQAGVSVTSLDNGVRVKYIGDIKPVDIQTQAYPGFPTDLQAQFMALMSLSCGTSVITENIFENRFMHVQELCRMGASITINGNSAIVHGVRSLSAAEVMASDLRASVSLILAGLATEGETKIRRIYHLDRGYESLEQKLSTCGAEIYRLVGDHA